MKITVVNGVMTATAETLEEMKTLLALAPSRAARVERKSTSTRVHLSKSAKFRRERTRTACDICGKKTFYVNLHKSKKHPKAAGAPVAIQDTRNDFSAAARAARAEFGL